VTLWVPVVVSFIVQVMPFLLPPRFGPALAHPGHPRENLWAILLMLVGPLALVAARRFPGPVVAVVATAATAAILFGSEGWPPYVALGFAIISAIVRGARTWAWASVAAAWVTTLVVALTIGESWHPAQVAGTMLGILVVFGIGEGIRGRRDHMAEYRRMAAERRVSEVQAERVRIARELHDVLAHSLSQINVQAGVGLHLMEAQPQKAAEALASIKSTSKTALDEVRSVLGVLRAEEGVDPASPLVPEPDLSRLPGLAASVTQQGVEVELVDGIVDPPPAPTQLALYRIVQESLTNVLRHARATRATVQLEETGGDYLLRVTDNGTAEATTTDAGRGLLGMRERAELLGGTFRAGARAAGGFEVEARIPRTEARR
jgi:signal transduction histidine kinase